MTANLENNSFASASALSSERKGKERKGKGSKGKMCASQNRKRLGSLFFLSVSACTAGLGTWQVKRYYWKVDLVETRRKRLVESAVPLSQAHGFPYERISLSGSFAEKDSMLVGPRSAPSANVGSDNAMQPSGYFVVTPFVDEESGSQVLVNRGWIPRNQRSIAFADSGLGDKATFEAVLANGEPTGTFTPEKIDKDSVDYFRMDLDGMKAQRRMDQSAPFVERVMNVKVDNLGNKIRAKTEDDMMHFQVHPMTHVGYAATWYGLCATSLFMMRKILK